VKRLALRAGLPDEFSPHWFRHGRLTIVARHAGLLAAQELAGHASPETTKRYTKITGSELKTHFDEADRRERRPGLDPFRAILRQWTSRRRAPFSSGASDLRRVSM